MEDSYPFRNGDLVEVGSALRDVEPCAEVFFISEEPQDTVAISHRLLRGGGRACRGAWRMVRASGRFRARGRNDVARRCQAAHICLVHPGVVIAEGFLFVGGRDLRRGRAAGGGGMPVVRNRIIAETDCADIVPCIERLQVYLARKHSLSGSILEHLLVGRVACSKRGAHVDEHLFDVGGSMLARRKGLEVQVDVGLTWESLEEASAEVNCSKRGSEAAGAIGGKS